MNYLHIHRQSNLITTVIASSKPPTNTANSMFIPVSERVLDTYYRLLSRSENLLDVAEFSLHSPSVKEHLLAGVKYSNEGTSKPMSCKVRNPR